MHLRCPHCRNPIELANLPPSGEITCAGCGSSFHIAGTTTATWTKPENRRIGKFEVISTLGQGAFGTVLKAHDTELDRTVAIKVPRADNIGSGPEEVDRFLREARAVAQLRFPSILTIHEVGLDNGTPYLVSDFVEGLTLADMLTGQRLAFRESAKLIADVADALQYAHSLGVIHRDVKPSNIMIRPDGSPCVMDFGLAKRDAGEITMTMDGQILGTPAYMSPEQARGEGHRVDGRSDVYSLGVILYQLLTGELPFRGNKAMLLHQVEHEEPRRPRGLNDKIPRDLETIVLKAMAKERRRRYESAGDLAADLRRWLACEPIMARPATSWERGVKWAKRRPALAGLWVVSAVSAAVLLIMATVAWQDAEKRAQAVKSLGTAMELVAKQEELVGQKREEVRLLEQESAREQAATALARAQGRRILYAADMQFAHAAWQTNNIARVEALLARHRPKPGEEDLRGFEWHYLWRLCHSERATLAATGEPGTVPEVFLATTPIALSPDRQTLAAVTHKMKSAGSGLDIQIRMWDLATGKEKGAFAVPTLMFSLAFTPDGQALEGAVFDPKAITLENAGAVGKADRENLMRVAAGQAKPSLQNLLRMYHVQAFAIDGRQLGAPEKLNVDRFLRLGKAGSMTYGPIHFQKSIFQGTCAAASDDGKTLALGGVSTPLDLTKPIAAETAVLVWDLSQGEAKSLIHGLDGVVLDLAFSPDGNTLAIAAGKVVKLHDVAAGNDRLTLRSPAAVVRSVTFSRDGKQIATGGRDGAVTIWDAQTGDERNTLLGHRMLITSLLFADDDKTLASVAADGDIKLWDPKSRQGPIRLSLDKEVTHLAFQADNTTLTAATRAGILTHFDFVHGTRRTAGKNRPVSKLAVSGDSRVIAVSLVSKGIVHLRDAQTSAELRTLQGHGARIRCMAFAPDNREIATASEDKTVKVWDVGTGAARLTLNVDAACLAFAADGKTLATASREKTLQLWDVSSGAQRPPLPAVSHSVTAVCLSANGTRLAAAGGDSLTIVDVKGGRDPLAIRDPAHFVRAIAFSKDGKRLATVGTRPGMVAEVKLWDVISGLELLSLSLTNPADHSVFQAGEGRLAFSLDGHRLAASEPISEGLKTRSQITIWDGTPTAEEPGH